MPDPKGFNQVQRLLRAKIPSATYCTASAASRTPSRRPSTVCPWGPSRCSSCEDSRNSSTQDPKMIARMTIKRVRPRQSPFIRPASSTMAVIAPGPAIRGMAAGSAALIGLTLSATLEHHLEGDGEQQQPAGNPEGGQGDAEFFQQGIAEQRAARQHEEGDDARFPTDLVLDGGGQPLGQ